MKRPGKLLLPLVLAMSVSCSEKPVGDFLLVDNGDGPVIGYRPVSGAGIITADGYHFKDLNRNGVLDPYEDWRLDPEVRAADLASRLTVDQIASLMLFTPAQTIPAHKSEYDGVPYPESPASAAEPNDRQRCMLENDIRHFLLIKATGAQDVIKWNNLLQGIAESSNHGIPCVIATDPYRFVFTEPSQGVPDISPWPRGLALAATFDPDIARRYGQHISRTLRALGISTVVGVSADLATEPRWHGTAGTFGEHPELVGDMLRAHIDGLQDTVGRGRHRVNPMVGNWPGAGTGEGGRDGRFPFGKFSVYPGENFDMHLEPFLQGALNPCHDLSYAATIIPSYNISVGISPDSTEYGAAYSRYMISDLLRDRFGFDGVVCTGWGVTHNEGVTPEVPAGKPWGAEQLTVARRHYLLLMAGVDQFGGNDDPEPVLEAYRMGVEEHGEEFIRARFELSARRILVNIFRLGLFENPYVDPEFDLLFPDPAAPECPLVVMLKNCQNHLPFTGREKVYFPKSFYPSVSGWGGRGKTEAHWDYAVDPGILAEYFELTEDPDQADFAMVWVNSPGLSDRYAAGYDINDRTAGGNGYVPISLQYRPYTADSARIHSIAAGDPVIDPIVTDRSYWEKAVATSNEKELDLILDTHWKMKGKPLVVVVNISRGMVFSEFEDKADAIIARFGTGPRGVLDIVSGRCEPSGLLPLRMPRDMVAVELQCEDVPFDMECHIDTEGNAYDFGFGLDWSGVIRDGRTERYKTPHSGSDTADR